jgi:thiamine-monophosphate kinase
MGEANAERGENALIRRLEALLGGRGVSVPFGDDMAELLSGPPPLLGTVDTITDGVDFLSAEHAWRDIGYKAMAVNVSDCAAMAVRPEAALIAVVLDNRLSMDDAMALLAGIKECADAFGCALAGGDTNSWDQPTAISITIVGRPEPGQAPVRRDGARPGDLIFVSGPCGGSLLERHLHPRPRVELALALNRRLAPRAMIDISDGVAIDLSRVCAASGCGAVLAAERVEAAIHDDARRRAAKTGQPALEHMLHDGEDFELIVVLPTDVDRAACSELGLLPLGRMVTGRGLRLERAGRDVGEIAPRGWEHFQ